MTNDEAIRYFKRHIDLYCVDGISREAEEMAIKALEQQPCEDAISRQAVEEIINDIRDCISVEGYCAIIERLKKLPPVTPQQKYGKWIAQQEVNGDDYFKAYDISGVMTYAAKYKCDKCGFIQICIEDHGQYNYCPKCGRRMVEPQESECDA